MAAGFAWREAAPHHAALSAASGAVNATCVLSVTVTVAAGTTLSRRVGSIASAEIAIPGKLDTGYATAFAHWELGVVEKCSWVV